MSHTNETANFHLPQFTAMDKPDWLVDVNDAFQAIDTGMASTQSEAESATSTAQLAQTTAEGAAETAGQASSDVAGLATNLETLQGTVNTVTALIGNGTPTTTDKTIIGAINEINAEVNPGSVSVTADGVKTTSQLLDQLFALVDQTKIGPKSVYNYEIGPGNVRYFSIITLSGSQLEFIRTTCTAYISKNVNVIMKASGSMQHDITATVADDSIAYTDESSTVPDSGHVLKIIY